MRVLVWAALISLAVSAQNASIEQLFQSAIEAQQRGDFTTAVRDYQQLLQIQPNLPDARANFGAALVHLGRFDEAIAEYRAALKIDSSNRAIRLNLALAYYKKGDYRKSAEELSSLHGSAPDDRQVAILLADSYSRLGDDARAVATLAQLQPAHPDDPDMAFVLGAALTRTGKPREGVMLLERAAKQGNAADAYLLAGSTLLKLDEKARALEDLQAAMRLNSNLPGLLTQLGIAEEGNGDDRRAEGDLRKALESNPDDFEANIHLGGILYARRDLEQARIYIQHALQIRPSSSFAIYEMALLKSASGQVDAAVVDLEKVVQADPNWLEAHIQLAALYYKLHRPADGLRERQIVERLTSEQQKEPGQPPNPQP